MIEEAATPTLEEVLERAADRAGGSVSFSAAVKAQSGGIVIVVDARVLAVALGDGGPDGPAPAPHWAAVRTSGRARQSRNTSSNACAVASDDAGFWPVTRMPRTSSRPAESFT